MFWRKKSFLKNTFLVKKNIFKKRILNFCIQKITFSFILPRKMHFFYRLRAVLKSTISKKMYYGKGMVYQKKNSFREHDFEELIIFKEHGFERKKFLWKVWFWNKVFPSCRFLN